ncbi:DNA recombination protein RmuC [Cellulosimicrobium sp. 22601]|uniref:DNA recombination protein RmuC n=1 Tax=unclassified Cellulosimicrobium TaxID=2624466 RepID=UPI003F8322A8
MDTSGWLLFAVGLVLGLVGGAALVLTVRRASPDAAAAEVRRLTQLLGQAQQEAARGAGLAERLEAEREGFVRQLGAAQRSADERLDLARATHEQQLAELRAAAERRVEEVQGDHRRLEAQFEALSRKVLAAGTEQFLVQAEERLLRSQEQGAAELERREEAVRHLVEPLAGALEKVRAEVAEAERARLAAHGSLAEQVRGVRDASELLRAETSQLVTALRSSQVRGAWGELQLRRVVEAAGMLPHVDFVEQDQVTTDDGALRPDMVVRLAGGKQVVVDAKVAFLGYLDAQGATDPAVRADRLAAHARHMRKHVDDLGAKRYWDQFGPAPEFVVMFVPAESFLSAAVEQDPSLLEHAVSKNVVIATPMTMVAMLRTIAYAWRQDALATNAQQVLTLGKELHGRLAVMGSHLAKLGRQLQSAADSYNRTVGSLETRVLVSARRFADLHVVDDDLTTPPTVNPRLSAVSAPELLASVNESVVAIDERPEDREDSRREPSAGGASA